MSEIDDIRAKRMEELQKLQQQQSQPSSEEEQMKEQIHQLESIVKHAMTKDALARFGNLRAGHPEKAIQLLVVLAQAIQQGQIQKVDDNTLKEILKKLTPKKKDIKIKKV